jgi:hypothetical protein
VQNRLFHQAELCDESLEGIAGEIMLLRDRLELRRSCSEVVILLYVDVHRFYVFFRCILAARHIVAVVIYVFSPIVISLEGIMSLIEGIVGLLLPRVCILLLLLLKIPFEILQTLSYLPLYLKILVFYDLMRGFRPTIKCLVLLLCRAGAANDGAVSLA